MEPVSTITGVAAPLPRANVDTDQGNVGWLGCILSVGGCELLELAEIVDQCLCCVAGPAGDVQNAKRIVVV